MYILIIYLDINKKFIRSIILFDKIKDIIEYTDGLIKYNDIGKKQQKYRTYKSFFEVIHVNGFNSGKCFR